MKISKIDRLVSVAVIGICLVKAVLYGGSKPLSPTNTPPDNVSGETSTNSVPDDLPGPTGVSPVGGALAMTRAKRARCPFPQSFDSTLVTNWTSRGAYSDWQRIDFPDGFAFPCGTNLLTSVTLMAWGELRCNDGALAVGPHQSATTGASSLRIVSLPSPVSLEPGVSTCAYGLTASNSFVFAWQNACVNRDATNRVDASIELFRSGAILVTTQPTNQPTSKLTNYFPPRPPEGFVGLGQDDTWALAAFPNDYEAITNKGYEVWLMEDKVGINEQNGIYKATITVRNLPDEGACYLVCGPYKVVVISPGTYSFPLEVFEHYEARTYPTAIPISVEYDDGYRGDGDIVMSSQNHAPLRLSSAPVILPVYLPASFYAWPSQIQLSQAQNAIINLWCNLSLSVECVWHSRSSSTLIGFLPPSMAEIRAVFEADDIEFVKRTPKGEARCVVNVMPDHNECCCGSCIGIGCSCGCVCHRHESGGSETNGVSSSETQH